VLLRTALLFIDVLTRVRRPNLYRPRAAYRPEPPHPVAIHASVVDFLASSHSSNYVPRATWHGYTDRELPLIVDDVQGNVEWPTKAVEAMHMDWKKQSWRKWAESEMPSFGVNSKKWKL
jgi:hypothetical protein